MMKFKEIGGPYEDATSLYEVTLTKNYTVSELIDEILTKKEWGYIGIYCKGEIFGKPVGEYRQDKMIHKLPENIMNKKVINVKASGGWSRMDYMLWLEQ